MDTNLKILLIAIVTGSMTLAPSLIFINSVDATPYYCRDYHGMSQNWINGCQQGWWDHNHCWGYSPGAGDYSKGYSVGWTKGHCK